MESESLPEMPEEGIRANAESLSKFSDWVQKDKKANFLYVQVPWKNSKYNAEFPKGLYDYSNVTADSFLSYLKENAVNNLDLRETIYIDQVDPVLPVS